MINFIKRYAVWFVILVLSVIVLYFSFGLFAEMVGLILYAIVAEMVALILSEFACYVYTRIDFIDKIQDKNEKNIPQVIGNIFIGVHILIGLIVLAAYQTTILESLSGQ